MFLCFSYLASLHSPSRKLCHVRHELLCFLLVVVYDRTIFILPNTFNVSLPLVHDCLQIFRLTCIYEALG